MQEIKTNKKDFTSLVALSIVLLLNILFVPLFSAWGGLFFNYGIDQSFFTALMGIGSNSGYWNDIFVWVAFVPAAILLISSLAKGKVMVRLSSASGAVLLFLVLIMHILQAGIYAISPMDGNITIGFWIALILFVICFFRSKSIKKATRKTEET